MISDIALIVTAIGVFCVVIGLRQSYRERLRQFEAMYVGQYWKILDSLSLEATKGLRLDIISDNDERAVRSYLRLCEDELEMRMSGYISDSTYRLWADGMLEQINLSPFKEIWSNCRLNAVVLISGPLLTSAPCRRWA